MSSGRAGAGPRTSACRAQRQPEAERPGERRAKPSRPGSAGRGARAGPRPARAGHAAPLKAGARAGPSAGAGPAGGPRSAMARRARRSRGAARAGPRRAGWPRRAGEGRAERRRRRPGGQAAQAWPCAAGAPGSACCSGLCWVSCWPRGSCCPAPPS